MVILPYYSCWERELPRPLLWLFRRELPRFLSLPFNQKPPGCRLLKRSFIRRKIVDKEFFSGKNDLSFASEHDSLKKPPNR